jgi:hypothetical protein
VVLEAVRGRVVGPGCRSSRAQRARHGGAWRASLHAAIVLLLLHCFWPCVGVLFKRGIYVGVASLYVHKVHADV